MHSNVRMKDVAEAAGVSMTTVSNVLNQPERVSKDTRDRIEQTIRELEYLANQAARELRSKHHPEPSNVPAHQPSPEQGDRDTQTGRK